MSKKRPSLISIIAPVICVLAVSITFGEISKAAETATVTATVTVQNISIEMVENATIAYGTISVQTTEETTADGKGTTPVANNNGNIAEKVSLQGTNSAAWTLSSDTTADHYFHKVCTADCTTTGSWAALESSGYYQIVGSLAASNSTPFDLQIGAPVTTSSYGEQNVNVSVQAATP